MMPDRIIEKLMPKKKVEVEKVKGRPKIVKGFSVCRETKYHDIKVTVFFDLLERQKTVICNLNIEGANGDSKLFTAKAKCHESDVFSIENGMEIALNKAFAKLKAYEDRMIQMEIKEIMNVTTNIVDMTMVRHKQMIRNKRYKLRP